MRSARFSEMLVLRPTGTDGTVLKVRPSPIWHTCHADLFAAAVAESPATIG